MVVYDEMDNESMEYPICHPCDRLCELRLRLCFLSVSFCVVGCDSGGGSNPASFFRRDTTGPSS